MVIYSGKEKRCKSSVKCGWRREKGQKGEDHQIFSHVWGLILTGKCRNVVTTVGQKMIVHWPTHLRSWPLSHENHRKVSKRSFLPELWVYKRNSYPDDHFCMVWCVHDCWSDMSESNMLGIIWVRMIPDMVFSNQLTNPWIVPNI